MTPTPEDFDFDAELALLEAQGPQGADKYFMHANAHMTAFTKYAAEAKQCRASGNHERAKQMTRAGKSHKDAAEALSKLANLHVNVAHSRKMQVRQTMPAKLQEGKAKETEDGYEGKAFNPKGKKVKVFVPKKKVVNEVRAIPLDYHEAADDLDKHGWEWGSGGRTHGSFSHPEHKNHEIHAEHEGEWHHVIHDHDSGDYEVIRGGKSNHTLHKHLNKFHGIKEEVNEAIATSRIDPDSGSDRAKIIDAAHEGGHHVEDERDHRGHVVIHHNSDLAKSIFRSHISKHARCHIVEEIEMTDENDIEFNEGEEFNPVSSLIAFAIQQKPLDFERLVGEIMVDRIADALVDVKQYVAETVSPDYHETGIHPICADKGENVSGQDDIAPEKIKNPGNKNVSDGSSTKPVKIKDKPAVKNVKEETEELDEISGKVLGSYIQKARADITKKVDHSNELGSHPSVKKITDKRSELYGRKDYDKHGRSKHRDAINKTYDKEAEAKRKLDPDYVKNTNHGKRYRGIEKAAHKLRYGKMTERTED